MDLMEKIYAQAKADPQIVAFPEADDPKMMQAIGEAAGGGYCKPLLVGDPEAIKKAADEAGVDISGMEIFDNADAEKKGEFFERYIAEYSDLLSLKALNRKSKDPMYTAMVMQCIGLADVTFAGLTHTTGDVILAATTIIGLKEGIETPSSTGLAIIPGYEGSEGQYLLIGDSAVCVDPSPAERASIAISSCETVQELFGWEPRCAMVSFSTDGSMEHEMVDDVRESVRIANELRPDLAIDGEFQMDAAISPQVAAKKVKRESRVAGKANIVIWPDINVGNIAVKILQFFAHADAPGPFIQGFRKIASDCSRSAPVSELVGNIIMCCVRAANSK
ncbi:MAG: phosphate acetyltransferase [Parasporobacterium sp.]|nr:phosphate acetyltransferase [Parasporobacterium sp.]